MAGKWTGGVVESMAGTEPPTVAEWSTVSVPGRPARFAGESEPIAYRREFPDPRRESSDRTILELRGALGRTHVWLNDSYLGDHDLAFAPARFEIEPAAENELLLVCERSPFVEAIDALAEVPDEYAVPSVRWGVTVGRRPPIFLRRLTVDPDVDEDGAALETTVEIDAAEPVDDVITYSVRPNGFRGGGSMERESIQVDAGERATVSKRIEIRDPSLWWPRGYGPQHRYTVRAKLGESSMERTVGLRHVEHDGDGFVVNGVPVAVRGLTVLPGVTDSDAVDRAVSANASILRVRGHVPSQTFYDGCDEAGVLVWQGLPTAESLDVGRALETGERLIERYGHHPALAAIGVQEAQPDPFETPLGSGRLAKLAFRWRCWRASFDRTDAAAVAEGLESETPVIPTTGPPGTGADASTLAPGWQYLEATDVDWLLDRYPSLASSVGGFGAASIATDGDLPSFPSSDAAAYERRGLDPASSRRHQRTVVRTVAEALRLRGSRLVVAETLADLSPAGGRGVVASDGSPKPAFEALAAAYEPLQAVVDGEPTPGSTTVAVVNGTTEATTPEIVWRAGDSDGRLTTTVGAHETVTAGSIEIPADADELVLTLAAGERTATNRYDL